MIIRLESGYRVKVRLTGPFVFDDLMKRYRDPPPVMRQVTLASGEIGEWPYEPPAVPPPETDRDEYELWGRYQSRKYNIVTLSSERARAQAHFFLLDCISVLALHPLAIAANLWRWWVSLWGGTGDSFPLRERYLSFLKTRVIVTNQDWLAIQTAAIAKEVTMDGILDAADTFRRELGRIAD